MPHEHSKVTPASQDVACIDARLDTPFFDQLESIAGDIERLKADAVLAIATKLAEARELFRYRRDEGGFPRLG